jgi:excinuclease ABC subunit C
VTNGTPPFDGVSEPADPASQVTVVVELSGDAIEALPDGLAQKVNGLPQDPGVYLFKNREGKVLYVGKALNLRSRVRQYFVGHDSRAMVPVLTREVADVEVVLVGTEKEALILENTLIKKHHPRFNVRLRDDKNFLHLRVDTRVAWPKFQLVRQIRADGARYFGPFHSASQARRTLAELQKAFPLRSCAEAIFRTRRRPCILRQMGRCIGPCSGASDPEAYRNVVDEACLFLEGRSRELVERLTVRMTAEAAAERFEEAARLRDLIRAMEATVERQQVMDPHLGDRDVWGLARRRGRALAVVLPVRHGRMFEPVTLVAAAPVEDDAELLSSFVNNHYAPVSAGSGDVVIPPEVLLPLEVVGHEALEDVLSDRRGRRVHLRVPERGEKVRLLDLAAQNAQQRIGQRESAETDGNRDAEALAELARVCRLREIPRRIECFDNSNLQGTDPVASMVVFLDGAPARAEYRRYRVKTVEGADDFATMREILGRRFRRAAEEGVFPDLVVLDGGRGQLSAAQAVLAELGFEHQPMIGLSKPRTERRHGDRHASDKIVLPEVRDPLRLSSSHAALKLLQRLRDEAHRHAIRYHRKVRDERALTSAIEQIPGIGPVRRRALLDRFGSLRGVMAAAAEEIALVPGFGTRRAETLRAALHGEE